MKKYIIFATLFYIWNIFPQDLSVGYIANDLAPHPMQPLAKPDYLSAATDPSFPGTSIRRISEAATGSFVSPLYSTIQSWNADESLMIVYVAGGTHRLLNGTDYTFIRDLTDIRPDDVEAVFWHFTDPDILFYMDDANKDLVRYNVRTQAKTVLDNMETLSGCSGGVYSGDDVQMMSWDSDVFSFRCENNSAYYYRISTGVLTQFNIENINYTAPMPFPSGNLFYHNTSVYDASGNFVRDLNIEKGEHSCLGKLSNGDDAYFAISFAQGPDGGCLGTLVAHNATTGNCFSVTPTEDYDYSKSGTHISALAHKNSEGGWVAVSSLGYAKDGATILDQELFIAKVDEFEGTVYRVAHHRSDEDDIDYWGEPHVTISPSGTRLLFASDWSGSEDGISVDAYVAELSAYNGPSGETAVPIANAGSDQSVTLPLNSITLNGSASDPDGGEVSFRWQLQSGPNTPDLSNTQEANATASNLIEGTYVFRLTVTDDEDESAFDEVQITVLPEEVSFEAPLANAGTDQTISLPSNSVTLIGAGSDPDGGDVVFDWQLQSGPNTPDLSNTQEANATASNLIEGTYVFRLTVTDDEDETAFDEIQITVLPEEVSFEAPLANAGTDQTISLPSNSVTLIGAGSDPDGGDVVFDWQLQSGPNTPDLSNMQEANATASNLIEGTYVFRLTVTDDENETAADEVQITVLPEEVVFVAPLANAGTDQTISLPSNSVTLIGAGSDPDGGDVVFDWQLQSGPNTPDLSNMQEANATASNLIEGTYVFRLTVTDDENETAADEVQITVLPEEVVFVAPLANAGIDQTISLPSNSVTLIGAGSDPDGGDVSFSWQLQTGPNTPDLSNTDQANATASNLVVGNYSFQLTVTDDENETATDDVTITVLQEDITEEFALRINAGGGQTTYNGEIFVADQNFDTGLIINRPQTGLSQPYSSVRFSTAQVMSYDIPLPDGEYIVQLHFAEVWFGATGGGLAGKGRRVFDVKLEGQLAEDNLDVFDEVGAETMLVKTHTVSVSGGVLDIDFSSLAADGGTRHPLINAIEIFGNGSSPSAPIANAGEDQTISLPNNSVTTLDSSGSDPDGGAVTFLWAQQSGPTTAVLTNENSANLTASNLEEGIYVFQMTVTDDMNETATDYITLTVLPEVTEEFALRINAGGGQITYSGETFVADQNFDTGLIINRPQTGLSQPYSSIRFSPAQVMSYDIPVPDGEYIVQLHFAEVWFGATGGGLAGKGRRVFDVKLEGQLAEDNLDIFAEVGAETLLVKTHTVNVSGGVLNIDFSSLAEDGGTRHPIINAIEILSKQKFDTLTTSKKQSNTMKVYLNQAATLVTVNFEEPIEIRDVLVFDMLGRLMQLYNPNAIKDGADYTIDVQSYEPGAYIIKMIDQQGKNFQKQMLVKGL